MNFQKIFFGVITLEVFAVLFVAAISIKNDASVVRVAFLRVGQGDAILISRGKNQVLIDTGKDSRALLSELGGLLPPWDRTIETVLLTHPDQDHVGAFPDLVARYRVGLLLSAELPEASEIGRMIGEIIDRQSVRRIDPRSGLSITLAPDARLEVLFPDASYVSDAKHTNEGSVVALLRIGEDAFLFTGDLPREEQVLPAMDIRVLKVAHHGSKYSTSEAFLDRTVPEEAVISVGKNSYGHPAPEVIERLKRRGVRIFRTDVDGSVIYECSIDSDASCILARRKL